VGSTGAWAAAGAGAASSAFGAAPHSSTGTDSQGSGGDATITQASG
jgi:hypothetical protein